MSDHLGVVDSEVYDLSEISEKDAANIVSLFLAQSDDPAPPHEELGYSTQREAFEALGQSFNFNWHTVKLTRDAFDRHTSSNRSGWEGELRPALKIIWEKYAGLERSVLLELSKKLILAYSVVPSGAKKMNFSELFTKVVGGNGQTKTHLPEKGKLVEFSNTGTRSDGWFVMTIDQVRQCLIDMIQNIDEFDSLNKKVSGYAETPWRRMFDLYFTNKVARTMGGVQSLPTFELLSKIIHFANSDEPRKYKSIITDAQKIEVALSILNTEVGQHEVEEEESSAIHLKGGANIIYYGAPGTGKSYAVDQIAGTHSIFRTVFHPDTQNSDFVGSLKPVIDDKNDISYKFSPGPFSRAMAAAYLAPEKMHYLVIEELNRAPAAAVFGELFLMLDRDKDGIGEYDVDFPSEEFVKWWQVESGLSGDKMRLPSNLSILATMNSADQGVYPLDTAFRRRWTQEYIPIDYGNAPVGNIQLTLADSTTIEIPWRKFVQYLNEFLTEKIGSGISEDRLVGQWFLCSAELGATLPGKLLIYLWDDLLRHHGRDILFRADVKTYGNLAAKGNSAKPIFSSEFLKHFSDNQETNE